VFRYTYTGHQNGRRRSVILKYTGTMAPILLVVGGAKAELAQARPVACNKINKIDHKLILCTSVSGSFISCSTDLYFDKHIGAQLSVELHDEMHKDKH